MSNTVAVFGLGSMGFGVATSLLRAGHEVYGFDVLAGNVSNLVDQGGLQAPLPDIGASIDNLVVVVLNAEQLRDVLFGERGAVAHLSPGSCVIACSTVAPATAREMAASCVARDIHYLDAPISGGSVKAAAGELSIMDSSLAASLVPR